MMQHSKPLQHIDQNSQQKVSLTYNFKDIQALKSISKSKFPVFLAYSENYKKHYAMKVFPYENCDVSPYYENEAQFITFSHPNLSTILFAQPRKKNFYAGRDTEISFLVTELSPYGDFSKLLLAEIFPKDEKLVRTFFRQLVEAIEYLHSNDCAHMDIKLENLLLSEDFTLKLTDFDATVRISENGQVSVGTGTRNYRSPELKTRKCKNPKASDIFSAAIVLFALKTGFIPYHEDTITKGYNLENLLTTESPLFWEAHKEIHGKELDVSEDFKKLFTWMVRREAYRATVSDIKRNRWYQGEIYTPQQVSKVLEPCLLNIRKLNEL